MAIDPQGRPTVKVSCDHYYHTWCPYLRPVTNLQNLAKQNKFHVRIVIVIDGTVGLAEGIIDGTNVLYPLSFSRHSRYNMTRRFVFA